MVAWGGQVDFTAVSGLTEVRFFPKTGVGNAVCGVVVSARLWSIDYRIRTAGSARGLAGTMPLVRGERPTWPCSAATCRRVERTTRVHHSVRASCARLSGGSPDRTGRWPVPHGPQLHGAGSEAPYRFYSDSVGNAGFGFRIRQPSTSQCHSVVGSLSLKLLKTELDSRFWSSSSHTPSE